VVAFDGEQTSFSRLQQRLGISKPSRALVGEFSVVYCVFDLLEAGGEDLTARPLVERRTRLGGRSGRRRACRSAKPGATMRSAATPRHAAPAGRD
jgi:ATP-dependent DNA ligase